jgi:acetyl-CoA carboxylase biotin carboxyl carrier protein
MDRDELERLRELVDFLKSNGIAEFDIDRADLKVRIKFAGASAPGAFDPAQLTALLASAGTAQRNPSGSLDASAAASASIAAEPDEKLHEVKSPIVGTFYEAGSPGSPPFVKVGDRVAPGQVLCIIESMKLMNEIECEVSGTIVAKLVDNGRPVEYGESLFAVQPS